MSGSNDVREDLATCAECGRMVPFGDTVSGSDGRERRCADDEECNDRKEARSSFTLA